MTVPQESAPISLGRLLRLLQQLQAESLDFERAWGLTAPQYSVLAAIVNSPGIDQRTVVSQTFIDKSTAASVVNRLVGRGLVIANRSPVDQRRNELVATKLAISLLYESTPELLARQDLIISALPESDRPSFRTALRTLGYTERDVPPMNYEVPSPDGLRPALIVNWGLGRPVRATLQRYNRMWAERIAVVTLVQALALAAIDANGELDQASLGATIFLDKASITEVVARLVRQGLVTKSRDRADARRRLLQLSTKGKRILHMVCSEVHALDASFLTPLEEPDRVVFLKSVRLVVSSPPVGADVP